MAFAVAGLVFYLFQRSATASTLPTDPAEAPVPKAPPASVGYSLGAVVVTNSAGWRQILPRADARGVLVLVAEPGMPAAAAYVTRGDVIVAIDQEEVDDADKFSLLLREATQATHILSVVSPQGDVRSVSATFTTRTSPSARYLASLDLTKHDPVAQFIVARTGGNLGRAAAAAQTLVQENPSFGLGYVLRARCTFDALLAGRKPVSHDEARPITDDVSKAVELAPDEPDVLIGASELFIGVGDYPNAETYARKAILLDPGSSHAHAALGTARVAIGRPQEAVVDLRRAIELSPYSAGLYDGLSKAYSKVGNTRAAASTNAVAREIAPRKTISTSNGQSGVGTSVLAMLVGVILLVVLLSRWTRESAGRDQSQARTSTGGYSRLAPLEVVGIVGLWALAIPLLSVLFGVSRVSTMRLEIAEFAIPGMALMLISAVGVLQWFRGHPSDGKALRVYGVIGLVCATWMLANQGETFIRATQGRETIGTVLLYASAGVFAVAVCTYVVWMSTREGPAATVKVASGRRRR